MNKQNQKTVKENNTKINAEKSAFQKFVEAQAVKQEEILAAKEARKIVRTRSEHFNLKNNVLLAILNSGEKGISVSEIMASKPLNNKKDSYSIHTINRDWNVEGAIQAEQVNLNEKGIEVIFDIDTTNPTSPSLKGKNNNRIKVAYGADTLEAYLLQHNCKQEWLKDLK